MESIKKCGASSKSLFNLKSIQDTQDLAKSVILKMKNYSIKIALRGVSPMVWRRLKITSDISLASLHTIIQIVNGWNDDYLHQFHFYGQDYSIPREGGMGFSQQRDEKPT